MDQEIVTCSMASQFRYPIPLPLLEDQFTYATEAVVLWTALQRPYGHSVHRLIYWEANNPSGVVAVRTFLHFLSVDAFAVYPLLFSLA